MEHSFIIVDQSHPHCTILTLDRPAKRNALNVELIDQVCAAIKQVESTTGQRAIIFKGAGNVFCAGLDLEEAQDPTLEERSAQSIAKLLTTIYDCPLVTIAAVHGVALAGGAGMMSACDLAIAETGTLLGLPETRRGLVAAQILPFVMPLLPRRLLHELILTGEPIEAHRAYDIGWINKVAKTYSALPDALKMAEIIFRGAPKATQHSKKLMQKLASLDVAEGLKIGLELHQAVRKGDEAQEGLKAFQEKRTPHWSTGP
jgi:methylglutaconyl-CoA hydratase